MKYIPKDTRRYDTDFTDDILATEWHDSELENDDLKRKYIFSLPMTGERIFS